MKGKKTVVILALVNISIIGIIIYFYINSDKNAPTIYFEDNGLTYTETMNTELLLESVKAVDDIDGDVSDSLVVEKITTDEENEQATIIFGARDKHGNIMKLSRVVPYIPAELEEADTKTEEISTEELKTTQEVSTEEESTTQETTTETEEETSKAEEEGAETPEQEEPQTEPPKPTANADANKKIPVITFKTGEVKTKIGQNPAWVTVIEKLTDDVDTYEQMLSRIIISGKYDNKKPGSYSVQISVKDSEGNESPKKNMTIIVEE